MLCYLVPLTRLPLMSGKRKNRAFSILKRIHERDFFFGPIEQRENTLLYSFSPKNTQQKATEWRIPGLKPRRKKDSHQKVLKALSRSNVRTDSSSRPSS